MKSSTEKKTSKRDDEALYILQDREGDYVSKVSSSGNEAIKLFFDFTKDRAKAKRFTASDLSAPMASSSFEHEFIRGYSGGRVIAVRR